MSREGVSQFRLFSEFDRPDDRVGNCLSRVIVPLCAAPISDGGHGMLIKVVDSVLKHARGRNVAALIAELVCFTHARRELHVVFS